jgi:hypothetical protein
LKRWIARQREIRRRWRANASRLVRLDPQTAYLWGPTTGGAIPRSGDASEFLHWTKVAAEVARIAPAAEMEIAVVQAIFDDEMRRRTAFHKQDD